MSDELKQAVLSSAKQREEYWFREGCYILELLNEPIDPDLSIARARVEPGCTTRWHRLLATTERYLVMEGRGTAEIGDAAPVDVGPGDVLLIPEMTRQRIHNPGPDDLVFLAICTPRFRPERYQELPEEPG